MSHIFISYSRRDLDFAQKIVDALAANNLDTWIDWKSIPKGEDWEQEIYRGIEEADAFLFLISPDSVASQMCNKEITHAVKNGKRILPIYISKEDPSEVHNNFYTDKAKEEIAKRNYIFCREAQDDFNKAIDETRKTIHTDYEWLKYHTELQVKALKWEQKKDPSRLLRGNELRDAEQQLAELNTQENPQPTKLQREFVLTGRRNEDQQRRRTTIGLGMGLAITTILAIFSWSQRNEAVLQSRISLSRLLSAHSQSIFAKDSNKQDLAVLLAIQSMQLYPSIDAEQILQNNILAHPISNMALGIYVRSVDFSPDGKHVVAGGDFSVHIWDAATGEQIAKMDHDGLALSVAFSPNGKYVASGSDDHTARVWDVSSGKEVARMSHKERVEIVMFSSDGQYVVSGSSDIRAWDVVTGKEISRIVPTGSVEMSFGLDGKYVAIRTKKGTVQVWDVFAGDKIFEMTFDKNASSVGLSPDGKYVAVGVSEVSTRIWDVTTKKEITNLTHESAVTHASFSSDGRYIVTEFRGDTVSVWEVGTGQAILSLPYYKPLRVVAFSPDGRFILTGDTDGIVHVWDISAGREVSRMIHNGVDGTHTDVPAVSSLAFSPDGKQIVSGSWDGTARVWEIAKGTVPTFTEERGADYLELSSDEKYLVSIINKESVRVRDALTGEEIAQASYDGELRFFSFSSDGKYFVLGNCESRDSRNYTCLKDVVRVWDSKLGQEIAHFLPDESVLSAIFSPDRKYLVTTGEDATIRVWELSSGEELTHVAYGDGVSSVVISRDGSRVVSGGCEKADDSQGVHFCLAGTARVWEILTGREIARMTYSTNVDEVAISPDGKYVASMSFYNAGDIWETDTGKVVAQIYHEDTVQDVTFSPNGKYLLSGSDDFVFVWDVKTGKEIIRVPHEEFVILSGFSPDSKYVASVSTGINYVIHIWETVTGSEVARITPGGNVRSVAFTADGRYLVSGGSDKVSLWLWRQEELPQVLIEDGCSRVSRNLTRLEWRQYIGDALQYQAVCPNLPIEPEIAITPTP